MSYNRGDNNYERIQELIYFLSEVSENRIEFLTDESLPAGNDLQDFMNLIEKVDSVIVILTPGYKKKAEEQLNSGVSSEYKLIIERLERTKKNNRNINSFCFIPLTFSKSFKDSCPVHLISHKAIDFGDFITIKYNRLPQSIDSKYRKYFKEICSQIFAIKSINAKSVEKEYKQLLDRLFYETKHDNIINTEVGQNEKLYVKTNSFKLLKHQSSYFFLGRKGSGKTTLSHLLFLLERDSYKDHIDIHVDKINLEYSANIILDNKSLRRDIETFLTYSQLFQMVWELFVYIQCFIVISKEYEENALDHDQVKFAPIINEYISNFDILKNKKLFSFTQENEIDHLNSLFQWCLSKTTMHIENSIKKSRSNEENFHFDVNEYLSRHQFLLGVFPENVMYSFYSIIKTCKRKFLISFDGFDTIFEKFRKASTYYPAEIKKRRGHIENAFLEGFLLIINNIKGNASGDSFYDTLAVCITVPKDRFLEIKYEQRDSYRYINRYHEIKWSGIELAIMLRKRLELLYTYQSKRIDPKTNLPYKATERFFDVIETNIPNLPKRTSIRINNKNFSKDTFINILRHSFWRPREILIYYCRLIAVLNDFTKRDIEPDDFSISKIISETTFDIIIEEFISEFLNYCKNIESIIDRFKNSKQIINCKELKSKISNIDFEFVHDTEPERELDIKVDFLFEIGFLGIEVSQTIIDRHKLLTKDIFCFNVSNKTFNTLKLSNFEGCNFIVHPIFCEYLCLDTQGQERLVLDVNWEYLRQQDIYIRH